MKSYRETITAGKPLYLPVGGRVLYIQNAPSGPVLDVEFVRRDSQSQKVERVGKGFKAMPTVAFEGIRISTSATQVVDFIITEGDIEVAFNDDESIIGNTDAKAIPVRTPPGQPLEVNFTGVVAPVFGVITNTNAQAIPVKKEKLTVIQDMTVAPINTGAAQLLVSDATLKKLIIRNAHATAIVHIGGSALTAANATIRLEPGDMWSEEDAPGAAWYAITDTAATDVRVTGVK